MTATQRFLIVLFFLLASLCGQARELDVLPPQFSAWLPRLAQLPRSIAQRTADINASDFPLVSVLYGEGAEPLLTYCLDDGLADCDSATLCVRLQLGGEQEIKSVQYFRASWCEF